MILLESIIQANNVFYGVYSSAIDCRFYFDENKHRFYLKSRIRTSICAPDVPSVICLSWEAREATDAVALMRASSGSTKDKWASRLVGGYEAYLIGWRASNALADWPQTSSALPAAKADTAEAWLFTYATGPWPTDSRFDCRRTRIDVTTHTHFC